MGREEKDRTKRHKLDKLQLMDDEWERLGLFNDLLGVRRAFLFLSYLSLTLHHCIYSTPIKHNMLFRQTKEQRFTSRYPRSRRCTRHGQRDQSATNIAISFLR
jgi:hypothetical protein